MSITIPSGMLIQYSPLATVTLRMRIPPDEDRDDHFKTIINR